MNLPNFLTLARLGFIPLIFLLLMMEGAWGPFAAWIALGIYVIGAITDFFDGWIARKFNQITPFGTFLDPISDKIFVGCLLVILAGYGRLPDLWLIPVLIILTREFLISGLREFLGPKNVQMPVTKLAKWKTATQMLSLGFLIIGPYIPYMLITGQLLLSIAALLTFITGWGYMKAGREHF